MVLVQTYQAEGIRKNQSMKGNINQVTLDNRMEMA